jgi:hypothetical protein
MADPLAICEKNQYFVADMNDWRKVAKNIYIWDYTTGFLNYLLPFPNFDVLAANFRYFSQSNVIGILEEGAHDAPWSEFSELKQWLIAKLMWNPNQSVDSLANIFITDYYGKAAPYVKQYYDLCKMQVSNNTHFTIKIDWNSNLYSNQFVDKGAKLINQALKASAGNTDEHKRIQRVAAQLYYLKLRRNTAKSLIDGTRQNLQTIIKNDRTIIAEHGLTFDDLLKDLQHY